MNAIVKTIAPKPIIKLQVNNHTIANPTAIIAN